MKYEIKLRRDFTITPNRMPFNWKNPFGYFLTMVFEFSTNFVSITIYVLTATLLAGSCWMLCCILDESPTLIVIATPATSIFCLTIGTPKAAKIELKKDFCNMVKYHADAKELSFYTIDGNKIVRFI